MEIIIETTNGKMKAIVTGEITISEGLLAGQIFDIEDIKEIKITEPENCFGNKKIFDRTFDETFE